jgi:hypothetical protein
MVAKRSTRARAVALTCGIVHGCRHSGDEWPPSLRAVIKPDEERGTGGVFDTGGARYPNDSDRYHRGDDRHQDGSERYQTGSEGTRSPQDTQPSPSDAGPSDYLSSMARIAAQKARDEERRTPPTWMPGPEDLDLNRDREPGDGTDFGTDGPEREYTSRQLGLRLRPKHYERLVEAARLYGVRPTTMARMMIVRGTNAIHDAELRARARELMDAGSE